MLERPQTNYQRHRTVASNVSRRLAASIGLAVAVGFVYFLAAWVSYGLTLTSEGLAVFWPASGVSFRLIVAVTARAKLSTVYFERGAGVQFGSKSSGLMAPSSDGPGRVQPHEQPTRSNELGGNPSSTKRWNDAPRGTMDEVSSHVRLDLPMARPPERSFHLVLESHDGTAYVPIP